MGKYHSDAPINDQKEDLFNRSSFADNVVDMLSRLKKDESFVVGLYAKWGFGKTSTINLIKKRLSKKKFIPVVVNAWSLDGVSERILWQILKDVHKDITGKSIETRVSRFGKWIHKFSSAKFPFDLDIDLDINGGGRNETKISSGKIINSIAFVGKLMESSNNITSVKKKMSEEIKGCGKKAVVFIDDIDRLNSEQIVGVLRLLSSIADYAGMTYVLPFDKDFVCSAIEECLPNNQSGDDYIEKIIQVPLHLPTIPQSTIDRVFTMKLDELLKEHLIHISNEEVERFQSLYFYYGANKYIQSPRDINKIINVLRFILPHNYGEISMVDSIILEIIRVFDEILFTKIKNNKDLLIKQSDALSIRYPLSDNDSKRKTDFERIFKYDEDDFRIGVVRRLFPVINNIYSNTTYIDNSDLRKLQRIASEHYFDIFFVSFDEQNGISDRKIMNLLNNASNKSQIDEGLKIINNDNYGVALKIITDNKDLINNKLDFCKALLDLAERLSKRRASLMLSAFDSILFTIDDILKDSNTKLSDYIELLDYNYKVDRIDTVPYLIRQAVLYSEKERARGDVTLNEDELEQYKKHALMVIRKIAKKNQMPINTNDDFAFLYSYWADFGTKQEISKYIKKHIKTAEAAIDFMSQFLGKWSEMGRNEYHRGDLNVATYKSISNLVDPSYLYDLIVSDKKYEDFRGIKKEDLTSFDNPSSRRENSIKELSKLGNEHTDAFRIIVVQQFIYLHEKMPIEAEIIGDKPKNN